MNIVHLETGRHLYGGARQALYLMQGLRIRGIGTLLACRPDSAIAAAAREQGLEVHPLPMGGDADVVFPFRLAALLRRLQPDILHVHSRRGADTLGGLAARAAAIPAVLSRRVDSPSRPVIGRLKYRNYRRVIAISAAIQRQLQQAGLDRALLRRVYSGVDLDDCLPQWSRRQLLAAFALPDDARVVACIAQLIPRKGHAGLLAAWARVAAACPQARLLVFGEGPLEGRLRAQVTAAGLDAVVRFCGFRPDLLEFLGRVDLVMHAASREGLGLGLLQAQAAGVPVVACRAGGVPEVIDDGMTGILVEPDKPDRLADAAVDLLQNNERRAQWGAAAQRRMAAMFGVEAMVDGNLAVYRELIDER